MPEETNGTEETEGMNDDVVKFDIPSSIMDALEQKATRLGLATEDLLSYIVEDWVIAELETENALPMFPSFTASPPPPPAPAMGPDIQELMGVVRLVYGSLFQSGAVKCPNCTMPLSQEDVRGNKCSNCGLPIDR